MRRLCQAFAAVEAARGDVSLTYFEFGTLAAIWLFLQQRVDVAILEVGLGGRLDAVNVFDADCAIVTSVDLDHMDYLGDDRESIGWEKAGIFRAGQAGGLRRSQSAAQLAAARRGNCCGPEADRSRFRCRAPARTMAVLEQGRLAPDLALPSLRGAYQLDNASACLAALEALKDKLPVTPENIRRGLLEATVPGRFQVLPGKPALILDVAHNPHAAQGAGFQSAPDVVRRQDHRGIRHAGGQGYRRRYCGAA